MSNHPLSNAIIEQYDRALATPGQHAWDAIKSLGRMGTVWSLERLRLIAKSPDWRFRRSAIEAIGSHELAKTAKETVILALGDESPYVVRAGCEVVRTLALLEAHDEIWRLIGTGEPYTRVQAMASLRTLWVPADFEPVLHIFTDDKDQEVREEASWVLRQHASDSTWRRLVEVWKADALPRRRVWVCEMAEMFGAAAVADVLKVMADDKDGHVRKLARRLLGMPQHPAHNQKPTAR